MKHVRRSRWLAGVLTPVLVSLVFASLVLAASAGGQSVHVVAGDGSGDFLQLRDAVTAAADGDVILVRPHTGRYDFTTINGKTLTVVGDGSVRPGLEDLRVRNLAAGQVVTLRFLDIEGRSEPDFLFGALQRDGLELISNHGCVWLEDLVIAGGDGINKLGGFESGWRGLVAEGSECVVLVGSEISGGSGGYSVGGTADPGGDGALLSRSQIALHRCSVAGGKGGLGVLGTPGQGGSGVDNTMSTVFVSGSSLAGGDTGDNLAAPSQLPSASGLVVRDGSTANHLATTFEAGGGPAPPGAPIDASGAPSVVRDLDDAHRAIRIPAIVREKEAAQLTYSGQPGDHVLLRVSLEPDWSFVASRKGVRHLGAVTVDVFLGAVGPAGTLDITFRGPPPPPGMEAATVFAQPLVAEGDGSLRLGGPSSAVIVGGVGPAAVRWAPRAGGHPDA